MKNRSLAKTFHDSVPFDLLNAIVLGIVFELRLATQSIDDANDIAEHG